MPVPILLFFGFILVAAIVVVLFAAREKGNHSGDPVDVRLAFTKRSRWISLPPALIDAFASRFTDHFSATRFAEKCEETGILKKVIAHYADDHEPDFVVVATSIALTSHGTACGGSGTPLAAKLSFELALKLNPAHDPAIGGLCITEFALGNYPSALKYAKEFLACVSEAPLEDRARAARELGIENYAASEAEYRRHIHRIKRSCEERLISPVP